MSFGWGWRPYVSVAERREQARRKMGVLKKKGIDVQPVEIEGRKIARTFWGESWCDHLESFSDYANRLPRGRTYVRNGSVCHLHIARGEIKAIVSGSELYDVKVTVRELDKDKWTALKERCAGEIGSLLELLKGRFSTSVMKVVTDRKNGLFPLPAEIELDCSCPDWADMCKHVAAVLYGVGARLDQNPELLFLLRAVRHEELIEADTASLSIVDGKAGGRRRIAEGNLAAVFGIDLIGEQGAGAAKRKGTEAEAASTAKSNRAVAASTAKSNRAVAAKIRKPNTVAAKSAATNGATNAATNAKAVAKIVTAPAKPEAKNAAPMAKYAATDAPPTGRSVRELRSKLGLTQESFGLLVGVTASSVSNWEKKRGRLNLQLRTLNSLRAAGTLTRRQALSKLNC